MVRCCMWGEMLLWRAWFVARPLYVVCRPAEILVNARTPISFKRWRVDRVVQGGWSASRRVNAMDERWCTALMVCSQQLRDAIIMQKSNAAADWWMDAEWWHCGDWVCMQNPKSYVGDRVGMNLYLVARRSIGVRIAGRWSKGDSADGHMEGWSWERFVLIELFYTSAAHSALITLWYFDGRIHTAGETIR